MAANEKLKEVLESYESLKIICNHAKEKICRNPGDSFAKEGSGSNPLVKYATL